MSRFHSEDQLADAMASAVRFLAARWRTAGELQRYLRRRGYSETIVQQVLNRCRERKFIDDPAYAEQFVRQRLAKGYGPRRLAQELAAKGLDTDIFRPLLEALDEYEVLQAAQQAAFKKANRLKKDMPLREKKIKIARHLYSKGFSETVIRRVVDMIFS